TCRHSLCRYPSFERGAPPRDGRSASRLRSSRGQIQEGGSWRRGHPGGRQLAAPLGGNALLGGEQDFGDGAAVGRGEMGVLFRRVFPREDGRQLLPHHVEYLWRQGVERLGVDDVAARIDKQPPLEVEFAQRSTLGIARA